MEAWQKKGVGWQKRAIGWEGASRAANNAGVGPSLFERKSFTRTTWHMLTLCESNCAHHLAGCVCAVQAR